MRTSSPYPSTSFLYLAPYDFRIVWTQKLILILTLRLLLHPYTSSDRILNLHETGYVLARNNLLDGFTKFVL